MGYILQMVQTQRFHGGIDWISIHTIFNESFMIPINSRISISIHTIFMNYPLVNKQFAIENGHC